MKMWNWNDAYTIAWHETDDPRIVAVIQRDDYAEAPYGDALCPAYYLDYPGIPTRAGSVYHDDESDDAAEAWQRAHAYAANHGRYLDADEFARRFMRIFYGTRVRDFCGGWNNSGHVLLLDTPGYAAHISRTVSVDDVDDETLFAGEESEWRAYLDGEVYGIGYAVIPGRVTDETEFDFDSSDVTMECWGFYGEDYAQSAALAFEYGKPALPEMLEV